LSVADTLTAAVATTAVAMIAAATAETAEFADCSLASAHAVIIAVAVAVVVATIVATVVAATTAATPVTNAAAMAERLVTTAANSKWFAAKSPSGQFAAAFGFRLAKPRKSLARDIAASEFANKFLILAAAPCAFLAPEKFNAA
jgi:hypothetical protein